MYRYRQIFLKIIFPHIQPIYMDFVELFGTPGIQELGYLEKISSHGLGEADIHSSVTKFCYLPRVDKVVQNAVRINMRGIL